MWRDAQRRTHRRHWPDVVQLLTGLPPDLSRQAKLLEYDLALRYSETGQFEDVFLGADQFPILSVCSWLLDDLAVEKGAEGGGLHRQLFVASLLLAARRHTLDRIGDADSFYDDGHLPLVRFFSDRAVDELSGPIPSDSPFWKQPELGELTGSIGRVLRHQRGNGAHPPDDPEAYLPGRWAAPATVLARAAVELAGREEIALRTAGMLDGLAAAFEIVDALGSMHRDLHEGRPSYPIAVVAKAAGMPLNPWPQPNVVLGAMVATGSLPAIGEAALAHVADAHRVAVALRLRTFAAYLTDVEAGFEERLRSSLGAARRPLVRLVEPTLRKALGMAEAFLLADPTLRESWEVHREGMFGSPQVTSRFPAGLVLEILCGRGHELAAPVDEFLAFTDANRFRYYDHAWSDVDTDTIGLFLRLQPYAGGRSGGTDALDAVLGCLERDVRAHGSIPVWLKDCLEPDDSRPEVIALGEGCGTVAAHLLLGLIGAGREEALVEIGAASLLDGLGMRGLGANVNYPPLYALATFLRLVTLLERVGPLSGRAAETRRILTDELQRARRAPVPDAQDAALVTIACVDAGSPDLVDPAWISAVLKRQRFDGGWSGEPFAAAPNRGGSVTWYASSSLTSALCYDALMRYAHMRGA